MKDKQAIKVLGVLERVIQAGIQYYGNKLTEPKDMEIKLVPLTKRELQRIARERAKAIRDARLKPVPNSADAQVQQHDIEEITPYPWCTGFPTRMDCAKRGYCKKDPNCGE